MKKSNMELKWRLPTSQLAYEETGGDEGRLFFANECRRLMNPYVPSSQTGVLRGSTKCYVRNHDGYVEYNAPYAHYIYAGILYVSSITGSSWAKSGEHKVKTDQKLKYKKDFHPLATDHWDKAMMVANKSKLIRAMDAYIRGRTLV